MQLPFRFDRLPKIQLLPGAFEDLNAYWNVATNTLKPDHFRGANRFRLAEIHTPTRDGIQRHGSVRDTIDLFD